MSASFDFIALTFRLFFDKKRPTKQSSNLFSGSSASSPKHNYSFSSSSIPMFPNWSFKSSTIAMMKNERLPLFKKYERKTRLTHKGEKNSSHIICYNLFCKLQIFSFFFLLQTQAWTMIIDCNMIPTI